MHPSRSRSSSPSDDGAHYYGLHGSTHSRLGLQPHLHIETAPTFQRDGYNFHSGNSAANAAFNNYLHAHPNRDVRQHCAEWVAQLGDPPVNSTSYYHQPNSPHISYTETTFSGAAQAGSYSYLYPQDGSPLPQGYDTLATPQIYHSPPTYIPPPRSSPHAHDATFTSYVDYAQGESYTQPIRAPRPSGAAPSNVSHLPYGAPMPPPSASYPGHIHTPDEKRCEWDGCNQPLGENSCAGVRRHLRDHHFRGNPPSAKDLVQCKWAGCRRDGMQWENIPKHVAECHTKSMTRTCSSCRDTFARSDTLKRHKEAGNCSGSSFR